MAKTLKEIFGLREMSINVPDKDLPALRKTIAAGIKQGTLPQDAAAWLPARPAKGTPAPGVKAGAPQASTPVPSAPVPAGPATLSKTPGGWASHKAKNPDAVNPARPTPSADLEDPWFQSNKPAAKKAAVPPPIPKAALQKAKQPLAPHLPAPKSAATKLGKGSADFKPSTDWSKDAAISGEFPDLPAPQSANTDVDNSDDYKSPFGNMSGGTSSWDAMPAWARDPEQMPRAGGGSQRVPRSPEGGPEDVIDVPGRLPKKGKAGPSPVGAQWTDKDVKGMAPKKPGMLSRLFGKKNKGTIPDDPTDDAGQKVREPKRGKAAEPDIDAFLKNTEDPK